MSAVTLARSLIAALIVALLTMTAAFALTSPEQFLGHRVGEDRRLVRYDKVIEYLELLGSESPRVRNERVGASTLGHPLMLTVISTEENMRALDRYRQIARRLVDPRQLKPGEAEKLIGEGKVFLLILCNQHSTEIASSNMAMELAHSLASLSQPGMDRWLKDVIVMIVPSANPDGQMLVVDHYNKYLGTPYEACNLPFLYHHYAGHDINRDWFTLNLRETDALVDLLYGNWHPQVLVDVHQMGATGVRMFVPPFFDPVNPNNHPLIWDQIEVLGSFMKFRLHDAGKTGVIDHAYYSGWYQGSIRPNATQHHITALLTENASVNLASPIFVDPSELNGTSKGLPEYGPRMNFTNPWKGGWWRLRDIVDYQLVACGALVESCSKQREHFLRNFHRMSAETIALPDSGLVPYAYLVPPDQFDPGAAARLLKVFERTRCELHRAEAPFVADRRQYPAGTIVLKLGQPYGRFIKDMLELKPYPEMREYPGGPPQPPYDNAAWTLQLLMGVEVVEVRQPFEAELSLLQSAPRPPAEADGSPALLDCRNIDSFRAVNLLLQAGAKVSRYEAAVENGPERLPAGAFLVEAPDKLMLQVADSCRVSFRPVKTVPTGARRQLRAGKIGVYRGWVPSSDEGWTRFVLDRFGFEHERLTNERVRMGNLNRDYAVIILPDLPPEAMTRGFNNGDAMPPEYRGGFNTSGVRALEDFVRRGGTLITLREACRLVMNEFHLPVADALEGKTSSEFFCPGSLLELEVDDQHPLGWGMPARTACFFGDEVVLKTSLPRAGGPDRRVVARYGGKNGHSILKSGWILGENHIQGMPAIVDVTLGQGHLVLCGLGVQHRGESWGTFKLLFNSILQGMS